MINRFIRTLSSPVRQLAQQSAAGAISARDTARAFLMTAHHTLMLFGVTALVVLGVMFVRPAFADKLKALSPFAPKSIGEQTVEAYQQSRLAALKSVEAPVPKSAEAPMPNAADTRTADQTDVVPVPDAIVPAGTERQQKLVTGWLSKRYRVAGDAANMFVAHAYLTAKEIKLDPLLILAVMAIESGFNPYAESPVGAQGLMQVMSKLHHEKFQQLGGIKAALNPMANIKVGSLILKDYVTRGGSVEAGLKTYVGAAAFDNDAGYGARVMSEYRRLKEVAIGKNVPIYTTSNVIVQKPRRIDRAEPKSDEPAEASAQPIERKAAPQAKTDQIAAL
ncbi:transglycosylase SLT domain-containing protein [Undibacterium arcticum]|uniref:Transglycosylase SLT domain-containing protein n=1 Tax=Undibacterium arcticum TaxID=1762892 RepID=A0ABV7EZZ0_9BURK